MEEQSIQEKLKELFETEAHDINGVDTFKEAGLMTDNKGVVISMDDGSEYQITIVKSR